MWQAAFSPSGYSAVGQEEIGQYRTNEEHIVSGMFGREKIHYFAPSPDRVEVEIEKFLAWFNGEEQVSRVIRSVIAHFLFVSIHPFEDGNGRLARILSDMLLALVEKNILIEDIPGAKRPGYSIVCDAEGLTQFFTEVNITEENDIPYHNALYKGKRTICERILRLDAERYQKGDLPLPNLLKKYCWYIVAGHQSIPL